MRPQANHGGSTPQSPWGSMSVELGLRLDVSSAVGLEELRLLLGQVDEEMRCLVVKYLLIETPLTKYDIAKMMGWGQTYGVC